MINLYHTRIDTPALSCLHLDGPYGPHYDNLETDTEVERVRQTIQESSRRFASRCSFRMCTLLLSITWASTPAQMPSI